MYSGSPFGLIEADRRLRGQQENGAELRHRMDVDRPCLIPSVLHQPEIVFRMLVAVLALDGVSRLGGGTRQRHVSLVACFCIDALTGPLAAGARCGLVRAGTETSGAIWSMSRHESCGEFGMLAPCARAKHWCGI